MSNVLKNYPLAPNGIFATVQGEGALLGVPMIFVRLAGCSVGCPGCDTNYSVSRRLELLEVLHVIIQLQKQDTSGAVDWVWITGGEPTDHNISPLVRGCHDLGLKVALATAGVRRVDWNNLRHDGEELACVDFLSVSAHTLDDRWVQRVGDQLNIVPALNGLSLKDLEGVDVSGFTHKYITPYDNEEVSTVRECDEWVRRHAGWRLGIQAHKIWGLP